MNKNTLICFNLPSYIFFFSNPHLWSSNSIHSKGHQDVVNPLTHECCTATKKMRPSQRGPLGAVRC